MCEAEIEQRGGRAHRNIIVTTDYLAIAAVGSRNWMHSTYVRKIEITVKLRDEGRPIAIISEWVLPGRGSARASSPRF